MITEFEIERMLQKICPVKRVYNGVRVTTQCMYPSNGLVRVTVRGGIESVVVSDDGEALGEASAAGIEIRNPQKLLNNFIRQRGLVLKNGVISTPSTKFEAAHIAILHVANTAKDAANWLYEHGGVKRGQDFRKLLTEFLISSYREQVAETQILGASNKSHKFANVISFANGHKFIVDAVANDPSSINSRVVANLDVRSTKDPSIEQRIVYDDEEKWTASDLNLLQVGATIIPYSRAKEVIPRLVELARAA
jgi:hypothetical protein